MATELRHGDPRRPASRRQPGTLALALALAALAAAGAASVQAAVTGTTAANQIVIANDNGSGRRVLTHGGSSAVSPDGALVTVGDFTQRRRTDPATNWRTKLVAAAGGAQRRTWPVACAQITWAPDSSRFACVTFDPTGRNARKQLLLFDATTGQQTRLAAGLLEWQVSFSPDSAQLAYVQFPNDRSWAGALKAVDLATRVTTTVRATGAALPAWGPDAIAFAAVRNKVTAQRRHGLYEVALVQPDGSGYRQVTNFRETAQFFGPYPVAWSADGTRLLGGMVGLDAWTHRLAYAVDLDRDAIRKIAEIAPSALSRDGQFVVGATGDAATSGIARSNIVRIPWTGGSPTVLLRGTVNASFNG